MRCWKTVPRGCRPVCLNRRCRCRTRHVGGGDICGSAVLDRPNRVASVELHAACGEYRRVGGKCAQVTSTPNGVAAAKAEIRADDFEGLGVSGAVEGDHRVPGWAGRAKEVFLEC